MGILMSNTYLLTSYSYTKGCEDYFKSAKLTGLPIIVVQYGESPIEYSPGTEVNLREGKYPGNTGRFLPLLRILSEDRFNDDDWFVFTDTHDITFQCKLPDLNATGANILVASEGKTFGQVDFWRHRLPPTFFDKEMFNVGCFSMKRKQFLQFLTKLKESWDFMRSWYAQDDVRFPFTVPVVKTFIGSIFNSYTDTMVFNTFVQGKYCVDLPGLFGCAAFHKELGSMEKKGNYFYKDGKKLSVVHMNGSLKEAVWDCK
jgi:hypothetical protein